MELSTLIAHILLDFDRRTEKNYIIIQNYYPLNTQELRNQIYALYMT